MGAAATTEGGPSMADDKSVGSIKDPPVFEKSPFDDEPAFNKRGLVMDDDILGAGGEGTPQQKSVSPTKLKRMALGQQSYMDHQRDYDQTLSSIDLNRTGTVHWTGPNATDGSSPQTGIGGAMIDQQSPPIAGRPSQSSYRTPPQQQQPAGLSPPRPSASSRTPPTVLGQQSNKRPSNAGGTNGMVSGKVAAPRGHLQMAGSLAVGASGSGSGAGAAGGGGAMMMSPKGMPVQSPQAPATGVKHYTNGPPNSKVGGAGGRLRSPPNGIDTATGSVPTSAGSAMAAMNNPRGPAGLVGPTHNYYNGVASPGRAPPLAVGNGAGTSVGPPRGMGPSGPAGPRGYSPLSTGSGAGVDANGSNMVLSHVHPSQVVRAGTSHSNGGTPAAPASTTPLSGNRNMASAGQLGPSTNGIKVRPFPRKGDNRMNSSGNSIGRPQQQQQQQQQLTPQQQQASQPSYVAANMSGKCSEVGDDDMIADFSEIPSEKLREQLGEIATQEHKRPDLVPVLAIGDASSPEVVHSLPPQQQGHRHRIIGDSSNSNSNRDLLGQPDFYSEVQQKEKQQLESIAPRNNSMGQLGSASGSAKLARPPTVSVPVGGLMVNGSGSGSGSGSASSGLEHKASFESFASPSAAANATANANGGSAVSQGLAINSSVSNVSNLSTGHRDLASPVMGSTRAAPPQQAPLPQGGLKAAAPIVKETKDVKRNRAQLPTTMTHARPTTGDWLNKRYIVNNYILLDTLGQGSYAEVRLCKERTEDKLFAMKIISKDFLKKKKTGKTSETYFEDIKREIAIMKKLLHPNILRLFEVLDDPKVNKMYLVLEYMKMGDLIKVLKDRGEDLGAVKDPKNPEGFMPLNDPELWHIFRQVVFGIKYLHRQNIVHGDIKPQNLLLREDGLVKIADFGISQMISDGEKLSNAAGTPAFMSPELCEQKPLFSGQLADVWAIGATMFMLRFGAPPFIAKSIINLYTKIVNDPLVFPEPIDPALQNLFELILEKDPSKRISLDQIMKHPWMMTTPAAAATTSSAMPTNTGASTQTAAGSNNNSNSNSSSSNISMNGNSGHSGSSGNLSAGSSSSNLNVAMNALKMTGKLKSMSFRPPESYAAEEAAAMKQPVQTIDQQEVYASIGDIQQVGKQTKKNKHKLTQQPSKIEDNEGDSDDDEGSSDDEEDEEVGAFLTKTTAAAGAASVAAAAAAAANSKSGHSSAHGTEAPAAAGKMTTIQESTAAASAVASAGAGVKHNPAHATKDIMDTGWGADVFGMVEDGDSEGGDDESVDDDDDDDDDGDSNRRKKSKTALGVQPSHNESGSSSGSGSADGGGSGGIKHNEMSQEEEARRALHFQKKVNAKVSSSNLRYTGAAATAASSTNSAMSGLNVAGGANESNLTSKKNVGGGKDSVSSPPRKKHSNNNSSSRASNSTNNDSALLAEPRSPPKASQSTTALIDNDKKVSFKGPPPAAATGATTPGATIGAVMESKESSGSLVLSSANSDRSLTPSSRSGTRSHLQAGMLRNANSDRRFTQSRDSTMSRGMSRDDLDEEPDQLTMEDFSRMMDTLAMQPTGVIDEENDAAEEMHRQAAELSIQGFCAELHNLFNGAAAAFNSVKGNRHSQEDRCVLIPNASELKGLDSIRGDTKRLEQLQKFTVACLFDGHNGWRCSHFLSQNFPTMLILHPNFLDKNCELAIAQTCETIDNQVCDYLTEEMDGAGSTGAIAIYDGRRHVFTVANVGDSMCVLSRGGKAVMLNRMHRLDNEEERERVKRAGGTIINSRVNGVLAISRAFGDTQFKAGFDSSSSNRSAGAAASGLASPPRTTRSGLVISKPDVHAELITPMTEFAILATDGLWDVMSAQMAVTFVRQNLHKHRDLEEATKELCREALSRGSVDNVTVVIISFHYNSSNDEPSSKIVTAAAAGSGAAAAVSTKAAKAKTNSSS